MELYEWLNFSTWLMPIPFMIIYHIKTTRFNSLTYPTIFLRVAFMSLGTITAFLSSFYFHSDVLITYSIMLGIGMYFLRVRKKLNYLQALSLAFVTSFLAAFYWEVPTFVYTIIYRGGIDQAMPLHILNAFPALFIDQQIKKINLRRPKLLIALGLAVSAIFLLPLILTGVYPAGLDIGHAPFPSWVSPMWVINRVICFSPLLYIVYRSELK